MATFSNMISGICPVSIDLSSHAIPSLVFFFVFFVSIVSSNSPENGIQTQLTQSINHFSADLFKVISEDKEHAGKNLVISAMSADIVLAMLSLGAKGETLKEINDALHLPNSAFTKAAYKPVIDKMSNFQEVTFNLANKVYLGEEYTVAPAYKNYATHLFSSDVENIDFIQNTAAAETINSWIEDKTNKTVKEVVEAADLNGDTALVLINTIYFKSAWENKFNPDYTINTSFNVSATKKIPIRRMAQHTITKYGESAELDAKILEMTFKGDEMSMVFILPNKVDGLPALEKKLTDDYANFQASVDGLHSYYVSVHLPKFKIETTANLNDALTKLGISAMFSENAELGDLLVNPVPLKVSKVIQKAFIDVNEEGVTAAAATGGITRIVSKASKVFHADHPFYYAMVNGDGQIVFSGHFTGEN